MTAPRPGRVIAVLCPCCEGSRKFLLWPCLWCEGAGRVSPAVALRYARMTDACAVGGYIAGDHDLVTANDMRAKAKAITSCIEQHGGAA